MQTGAYNTVPKRYPIPAFASPIARGQGILWALRVQQHLEMVLLPPIPASRRILSCGAPNRCSDMPVADLNIPSRNSRRERRRTALQYHTFLHSVQRFRPGPLAGAGAMQDEQKCSRFLVERT